MKFSYSLILLLSFCGSLFSQSLDINSCPVIDKRSNGNGQASSAAGDFTPTYTQNNPVAPNVVGTIYQKVNYNPTSKTGNYNLKWTSGTSVSNLPVITRVWTTNTSNVTTLSSIVFGPPPPSIYSAGAYYVNYCFYVQNMPPAGRVTLEFSDPQTSNPVFRCTYDLSSNTSTTSPIISCEPTINSNPSNQFFCDNGFASFCCNSSGTSTFQWQYSSNSGSSWNNISLGGDYTKVKKDTLTLNNRLSYNGYLYRVLLTNSCGTTTSTPVQLTVNNKPTAIFSNSSSLCGLNITRSLGLNLTGSAPWALTYTENGVSKSITGITTNPYYISVTPTITTTYSIISVSDAKCVNNSPSGNIILTINPIPTIAPVSSSVCIEKNSFNLAYTSSGSPNQYSITTGVRSLSGFSNITSASLSSSSVNVTIPTSGITAGVYDFNMIVTNSSNGCSSLNTPFTLTIQALPVITTSADKYAICSGTSVNLNAVGASSYTWISVPSGFSSLSSSPSASPLVNTTYSVSGTGANGCISSSSLSVVLNANPTITITPSATTMCLGDQISLTASGGNLYTWLGPSSYTATGTQIIVSPNVATVYTLTGTSQSGCIGTTTQLISIGSGATINVSASSATVCAGATSTLSATGATSYIWAPTSEISGSNVGASIVVKPSTTTTYTVYATTNGCTSTKTIVVSVASSPVISVPTQVVYCGSDYSGSNQLVINITTSSSQNFSWYHSADGATGWSTSFSGQFSLGSTTGTLSTLNVKTPATNDQFFKVEFTTSSGCFFSYPISIKSLTTTAFDMTSASNQTICSGSTPNSIVSLGAVNGSGTSATYTTVWQSSTDNISFTDIVGANTYTYSPGVLTQNTWYRIKITSNSANCPGPYYSSSAKITIASAITNNILSVSNSCVAGAQITGSTPSGGNGSFTYSWEISTTSSSSGFSTIVGVTSQNYTPSIPAVTTWFRRLVTSGSCLNSSSASIVIYPPILNGQISNGQTICYGASLSTLTVSPSGGETASSFSYLWYTSINNISFSSNSVITASYSPNNTVGTYYYRVTINRGACSYTSNVASVVINPIPTITISSTSSLVCSGKTADIQVGGASTYAWSPSTYLSSITGALVTSTPLGSVNYSVTGTSTNGCTSSNSISITYAASPSDPTVVNTSTTICNNVLPFDLSYLISSGSNTQWYSVPNSSSSYSISNLTSSSGTYYVYSKSGSCYSNNSANVTLVINNVSAPVLSSYTSNICSPGTINLTAYQPVPNSGTILEWHVNNSSGSSLVTNPLAVSAGTYYLFAYSTNGLCYGSASTGFNVTINPLPVVTTSPSSLQTCEPGSVDLTSTLSSTAGITYQWYTLNSNPPDASSIVLDPKKADQTRVYYVYAFNNTTGCVSSSASSVNVTINPVPKLSLTPSSYNYSGTAISMSVSILNTVSSPTYQWQIYDSSTGGWNSITNTGVYSGCNTAVLSISSNAGLDGAAYRCYVSAGGCSNYSSISVVGVDDGSSTLPIELISFNVVNDGNRNKLLWKTASELNNDFFAIEHSKNAIDFIEIAKIDGAGTSNSILNYTCYDNSPFFGITYYRLKQFDFNGTFKVSKTIYIECCNNNIDFSVFPNPIENECVILFNQSLSQNYNLEILNYLGQIIIEKNIPIQSNYLHVFLGNEFVNGVYYILLKDKTSSIINKKMVVKQ